MRFFAAISESGRVTSTLATRGEQPPNTVELLDGTVVNGRRYSAMELFSRIGNEFGWRYVNGAWSEPTARAPLLRKVEFALLFRRESRDAIRQYRRAQVDEDIEDFYSLLEFAGDTLDLGDARTAAMVSGGLALLRARDLITDDDVTRIPQGIPPQ